MKKQSNNKIYEKLHFYEEYRTMALHDANYVFLTSPEYHWSQGGIGIFPRNVYPLMGPVHAIFGEAWNDFEESLKRNE